MKNFKYLITLLILVLFTSCSENEYSKRDKDWPDDPVLSFVEDCRQSNLSKQIKTVVESASTNPITVNLILIIGCYLLMELWLQYATFKVAQSKHRMIWLWLFNSFMGGVWTFIILSLSKELKYREDFDIREESDILGITMALGNIMVLIVLFLVLRLYWLVLTNPGILIDFIRNIAS